MPSEQSPGSRATEISPATLRAVQVLRRPCHRTPGLGQDRVVRSSPEEVIQSGRTLSAQNGSVPTASKASMAAGRAGGDGGAGADGGGGGVTGCAGGRGPSHAAAARAA